MRALILVALLLLPSLGLAVPTTASEGGYTVTVTAEGMRDGVTYEPFVAEHEDYHGLTPDDDPTDCRFAGAELPTCPTPPPMKYGQYYRYTVRVVDADGRPVVNESISVDINQGRRWGEDGSWGRTDANGTFTFVEIEPVDGVGRVVAEVEFFHPSDEDLWTFAWRVEESLPPEFPTVHILPEGEWLDLEIVPLKQSFFRFQFGVTATDAPDTHVRAFFGEATVTRGAQQYGIAHTMFRIEEGDVHVEAHPPGGPHVLRHDLDAEPVQYYSGGGWARVHGEYGPGDFTMRVRMGAVGMAASPGLGLTLYGDPDAYEVRVLDRGVFRAHAGELRYGGVSVNLVDFGGVHAGTWSTTTTVPEDDSFVFAVVGVGSLGRIDGVIRHDQEHVQRTLPESSMWIHRQGPCGGEWTVAARTSGLSATMPHAFILVGEGMPVAEWVREAYDMPPGSCALRSE